MPETFTSIPHRDEGYAHRFRRDERGAVAILFALSATFLVGIAAVAIEYSRASSLRERAKVAADRAVLAAVTAMDARRGNVWSHGDPDTEALMRNSFEGAMTEMAATGNISFGARYNLHENQGVTEARLCFDVTMPTVLSFSPVGSSIVMSNCVAAQTSPPTFVDIHLIIDASGSMGIGASSADQDIMQRTVGCMFACHTINWRSVQDPSLCSRSGWWSQSTFCAAVNGAQTRFDVAKEALVSIFEAAQNLPPEAGQFAFSVHKFSNYTTLVHPLSTDYRSLIRTVRAMEMDIEGAGTNIRNAMAHAERLLPVDRGDGSTAARALQHVFLISDGLENNVWEIANGNPPTYQGAWRRDTNLVETTPGFWHGDMRNQVFDHAVCSPIKDRGARISTLSLEYVVPASATGHMGRIRDQLVPHIPGQMQRCASSDRHAYIANDPVEIRRAIDSMFHHVVNQARLTQ